MFIKNIKLTNYRNYASFQLSFGKNITLLIGKNGIGKTNLIAALKQSLSFIFSHNAAISQYQFVADSGLKIKSFETTDARFDNSDPTTQGYCYPVKTELELDMDTAEPLVVEMKRMSLSVGIKESYVPASIRFWERYNDLRDLPVLGFYSDSYPHIATTLGRKIQDKINSGFVLPQNVGYYNWDDPRDCSNVWQQYFVMQWKNNLYNPSENTRNYVESIRACMIAFASQLPESSNTEDLLLQDVRLTARGKNDVMVFVFNSGQVMSLETMPAGFRRIFSIAFDIANRGYILNGNCNPSGIVFIDEVDLHLHPSLSQEIIERLSVTFPRLQIIATTHSPLVLSNFKQDEDNVVFQLAKGEDSTVSSYSLPSSYGVDYDSILTGQMETPIRNSYLRDLLEAYRYWERNDKPEQKAKVRKLILDRVGENSVIGQNLLEDGVH